MELINQWIKVSLHLFQRRKNLFRRSRFKILTNLLRKLNKQIRTNLKTNSIPLSIFDH